MLAAVNTTVSYSRNLQDALTQRALTVEGSTWYQWYDYDGRGLLWKAFASPSSTKPATPDVTYTYRPSGQVASRQFAAGSPATAKRHRYLFGATSYDALNRLTSADFSSWSGSAWTATLAHDLASITYDPAGNITALQRYRENATLIDHLTYSYPGTSNRLSSVTDAVGVTAESWDAESGAFTYDANGNLTTAPAPYAVTAVSYDQQSLPLTLTSTGTTTTYRYDHAGQRIAKQVGAGNTELYLLEGAATLGVVTVNGAGSAVSWHVTLLAGDKVVGRQPNVGNRKYYHTDLLGSTRAVVEGTTVVESYDFDPWGLLMPGRTLAGPTKEGFTSKERDVESGLDYFGARYYMAALARWTAVDPLAEKHLEWSPYNYVLNNPLALVDPDGRQVAVNPFQAGVGSGVWSGVKGTMAGLWQVVRHPIQTGGAVISAVADLPGTVDALGAAIGEQVDKVTSGDAFTRGEVVGELLVGVADVVVGSKGLGTAGRATRATRVVDLAADAAESAPTTGRRFATQSQRDHLFEQSRDADGVPRCEYCGTELDRNAGAPNSFQADHVNAWSRGGQTTDDNLAAACASCNSSKGNKILRQEWTPPKERPKQ